MDTNWRILWQVEDTWTLYTVPVWFTCMVTELFIVNSHATAIKTYSINVVKKWWSVSDLNLIAHNVQIEAWYFWDRLGWFNMPLAEWDFIVVSGTDCTFSVFWYEVPRATSTGNVSAMTAQAELLMKAWLS